jgi:hypothetical protein
VKKGYVTRGDNAQLALTADGVDFVERERGNIPVLNKLLTSGSGAPMEEAAPNPNMGRVPDAARSPRQAASKPIHARPGRSPIILPVETKVIEENGWVAFKDRRMNKADRRADAVDRRANQDERRKNPKGRRSTD